MTKKFKAECQNVQNILLNMQQDHLLSTENSRIRKHMKYCQSCREFQENLNYLRAGMRVDAKLKIEPRKSTRQVLVSRFREVHRKTDPGFLKFLEKLKLLFSYRIPLYQALAATVVVALFILFFSQSYIQQEAGKIPGALSTVHDSIDVGLMDIRINLNFMDENNTGRNLKEDSSLTRYITTSL